MTDLVGFTPSASELSATDLGWRVERPFQPFDTRARSSHREDQDDRRRIHGRRGSRARDKSTAKSVVAATTLPRHRHSGRGERLALADPHRHPRRAVVAGRDRDAKIRLRRVGRHGQRRQPPRDDVSAGADSRLRGRRGPIGGEFALEPRGVVDLKGKGEMDTWFVTGRR